MSNMTLEISANRKGSWLNSALEISRVNLSCKNSGTYELRRDKLPFAARHTHRQPIWGDNMAFLLQLQVNRHP